MTVGQLMALLEGFPAELPVFFQPEASQPRIHAPATAETRLVHPERLFVASDDDPGKTVGPDFIHALVLTARDSTRKP